MASLCIPTPVRKIWLTEATSYLHEADPEQRRAWCRDLVLKAPLTGAQLAHPGAVAGFAAATAWLADCARRPKSAVGQRVPGG